VLPTIVHTARSDSESLHDKLQLLFQAESFNLPVNSSDFPGTNAPHSEDPNSIPFLSYTGTIFNRIKRVLSKYKIKSIDLIK
jgi:hypothetical protein